MRASENGHLDAVELILSHSSTYECQRANEKGWTALMMAAYNGFGQVVTMLLANGACPDARKKTQKSSQQYTAMCYACMSGHLECVHLLIDAPISLNAQRCALALKLAEERDHQPCVAALRAAGAADPTVKDASQQAVAHASTRPRFEPFRIKPMVVVSPSGEHAKVNAAVDAAQDAEAQVKVLEKAEDDLTRQLKALKEQLSTTREELAKMREDATEKRKEARRGLGDRPPWAFSPSGKWRPGLWSFPLDRGLSISNEYGDKPHSVSFAILKERLLSA